MALDDICEEKAKDLHIGRGVVTTVEGWNVTVIESLLTDKMSVRITKFYGTNSEAIIEIFSSDVLDYTEAKETIRKSLSEISMTASEALKLARFSKKQFDKINHDDLLELAKLYKVDNLTILDTRTPIIHTLDFNK